MDCLDNFCDNVGIDRIEEKFCVNCGKPIKGKKGLCKKCSATLKNEPLTIEQIIYRIESYEKICPKCGKKLATKAKFCTECGAEQPEKIIESKESKPAKKTAKSEQKTVPAKVSATAKPSVNKTTPQKNKKPASKKTAVKKPAAKKTSTSIKKQKTITAKKTVMVKPKKKGLTYQEIKDEIYKMTPQDNCGECGCKNCMQFAMQAASPKNSMELTDCPYIDEDEAEEFLNSL